MGTIKSFLFLVKVYGLLNSRYIKGLKLKLKNIAQFPEIRVDVAAGLRLILI